VGKIHDLHSPTLGQTAENSSNKPILVNRFEYTGQHFQDTSHSSAKPFWEQYVM